MTKSCYAAQADWPLKRTRRPSAGQQGLDSTAQCSIRARKAALLSEVMQLRKYQNIIHPSAGVTGRQSKVHIKQPLTQDERLLKHIVMRKPAVTTNVDIFKVNVPQ